LRGRARQPQQGLRHAAGGAAGAQPQRHPRHAEVDGSAIGGKLLFLAALVGLVAAVAAIAKPETK